MSNILTEVTPQLLAQGLMALRENAIAARLVNRGYEATAGQRGSTIDVPIPSAIAARQVSPAVAQPANVDSAPTSVAIPLDQWWEAPFHLSDKDMLEAVNGIMPMQASEAVKSLGNKMDAYILGLYTAVYSQAGSAGTAPFASDIGAYIDARKRLNTTLAPMDDRRVLLNVDAESNALKLPLFLQADQRGDQGGVVSGFIGRKVGADWFMDQNIPSHTAGTAAGLSLSATATAGATSLSLTSTSTAAQTLLKGDLLTIGSGQYVVTANANITAGAGTVNISPAVPAGGIAGATGVTKASSHAVNLLFHRDAFAFATRPLESTVQSGLGSIISSAVDPISGLTLRLEVSRQYKQTTFSYDVLFGGACVRPELACRILG